MNLDDHTSRFRNLSPEKRQVLLKLLREEAGRTRQERTLPQRGGHGPFPLSFAQQRLWFLDRLTPGSPAYNVASAVRLEGPLDVPALAGSFREILRRHCILRARFSFRERQPVQEIAPPEPVRLPVVDLRALPAERAEAHARELDWEQSRRPFDLASGPLLRALLLRLGELTHDLVWTVHHIVSDGWSSGNFVRELGRLYEALRAGRPARLPELPVQYTDYVLWQRERLSGEALAAQLAYWRARLAGAPALLDLPTDRRRPAVAGFQGGFREMALDAGVTQGLSRITRQVPAATPFMTLAAGFAAFLARLSGQSDILVGTPVANRVRPELEPLIGLFVNTLVLRADLSGNPTFHQLLVQVREAMLGAYDHQDLPLEKLVDELELDRSLSHSPLFQVTFALQNAPAEPVALGRGDLSLRPLARTNGTAKFDLSLSLAAVEGRLEGGMQFRADLFDPATLDRWIGSLSQLLAGLAAEEEAGMWDLPLLRPAERQQLLEWSGGGEETVWRGGLHEICARWIERSPAAVAAVCGGESLTYGELGRRAGLLSRRLLASGVRTGERVGICAGRNLDFVVGILGILGAGGAYLPLDPAYPPERLALLLDDSAARTLVVGRGAPAELPEWGRRAMRIAADAVGDANAPPFAAGPLSPAYVIYTSGSTGRPKGVVVTHGNVGRLFAATAPWLPFGPADVSTLFHSFSFDFSVWELWGALLHGGRLVVVPYETSRSPRELLDLLERERVTALSQTPSAFQQLAAVDAAAGGAPLAALRWVVFGGEALDPRDLATWLERHGEDRPALVNMYGITETTVHVTYRPIGLAEARGDAGSLIGRAIPDLAVHVLDRAGRPVPIGVAGELHVGGAGVSSGYLGRPALTAERFVPDPWSRRPGERLYRAGDLARWRPAGELEYLGRIDQQVKIRGFRIELGEIEAALVRHPSVEEAVVLRLELAGEGRLVAWVVGRPGGAPKVEELRRFLSATLPDYMLPAFILEISALPLTENGKLDRAALPLPEGQRPELAADYVAPRTPAEVELAAIWSEVLGIERVGSHDNFFALGGDSILSLRILALAGERGLALSLSDLFRHQTVAELAAACESAAPKAPRTAGLPSRTAPFSLVSDADRERLPAGIEDAYPLTQLQAGMLYHMELTPDEPLYQNVDSWHVQAPFAEAPFRAAVARVVARHPVLRTSFDLTTYGEPLQLVHREAVLPLEVADLRHLSPAEQEGEIDALVRREKRRLFDLSRPPQLRFHLHRRSAQAFQFTLTENHAILDGWSLHSILAEIFTLYFALLAGEEPEELPPLGLAFRDYVALERQALASEEAAAYWSEVLRGATPGLLPAWPGWPAAAEPPRSREAVVEIAGDALRGLRDLARRASVPLKSVFLSSHLKVLALLGGRPEVLTGMATNGRLEEAEGDQVSGLFLNSLPFRLRLPEGSWIDLARAVLRAEEEMLPFRRYPLAALQRQFGALPLFEVNFNFVHFHVVQALQQSGHMDLLGFKRDEGANFKLTVNFAQNIEASRILTTLEYDAYALPRAQMEEMAACYGRVLAAMVAGPGERHETAPLLSAAARHQLLAEWSGGQAVPAAADLCLHEIFAARAMETPGAPAVVCGEREVTYRELDRQSDLLARALERAGVGPEVLVGLVFERSIEIVAAILGVLKAGGAYLPLDPHYPEERLSYLLADSGTRVLVTETRLLPRLPAHGARVVLVDDLADTPAAPTGPPAPAAVPGNAAYVIYTSGSTGRPKGVVVTHAHVARLFSATAPWFGFGAGDVWTLFHSYAFDFSVWEIWGALLYGGRLVVVPYLTSRSPEDFYNLLRWEGVTVLNQTPSAFRQLLRAEESLPDAGGLALRYVVFGGERLDPASLAPWLARHGDENPRLVNMYGITEATVHVTYGPLAAADARPSRGSAIGVPIPDLRVYLLDPLGQPVPVGVPGEIHVGGAGPARGYLGRPELTAERFVPDPFGGPGGRLYRSGDLARFAPDGTLEYLGRGDQQVKIRGFRVEVGEIEAALATLPGVREAVVLLREDGADDQRLVAYVTGGPAGVASPDALREGLRRSLPEHMVPAAIRVLDTLPRTSHDKIDRAALPAIEEEGPGEVAGYLAPRGPVEEILAAVWAEVLGRERVGVRDDFFDLGGHSLLATQVMSRLRGIFQIELPVRSLFDAPILADLARAVEEARRRGAAAEAPPIRPLPRDGGLPLSFAQERLWFLDQLQPGNPAYNVPWAVALGGPWERELLARTLAEVVRRHEVLRTTFRSTAQGPVQVIAEESPLPLPLIALDALPRTAREGEVRRLALAEAGRPFDLAAGPLLRTHLVRLAPEEQVLLATVHHIASDGWSMGVMWREIGALYAAYLRGEVAPLPELPVQYADFAAWQRAWLQGEVLDEQLAYWKGSLAGAPRRLELPTDRPRPALSSHRGAALSLALPEDLAVELARLDQREKVTPFMTCLAAFGVLLGRSANQEDLLVGTPIANRTHREIEGLIGFFVNTLVLRLDLSGAPSFRELLGRVRQTALDTYSRQDLPFERLVDELAPDRDPRRAALFQVMFAFQNTPAEAVALPGLAARLLEIPAETAKFDLTLGLAAREGTVGGSLEYSTDLFDATTIERMWTRYLALLSAVVRDPGAPVADLPLLTPGERQQVLEWGGKRAVAPERGGGETLAGLFAARVRETPHARAVTCQGSGLTYGELDRRANRLAHRLLELGVRPEERVGLSVERSLDLVIGLLGIVKAGGAYVPLDPDYPRERRAYMVEDAGARVVVGTERALADLPRVTAVLLDAGCRELAGYPEDGPPARAVPANLAYVIYTSGSTGRPKGVGVSHGNVARLFRSTEPWFGFTAGDVWTLFHSYAFDFSVWELWGALLYGGALVIVPQSVSRMPADFRDLLEAERVTVLNQTPSAFARLVGADEAAAGDRSLAALRQVIFGGEALEPSRLAPWFARRSREGDDGPRLVNMYGITETTVHVTYRPLRQEDAEAGRGSFIGIPIPDLSLHLLDPGGRLAPVGIPGELAVGGAGVARGYLSRPELTAERFVPDPLSEAPGARRYRSGDLGRFLPTGELEYLGRIDQQVKIRGFRVELEEIQLALAEHPGVREAVVLARPEEDGERRLVAYVVAREEPRPTASELRERLAGRLPEHMVPAALVLLDTLPLTGNSKVDREALLALPISRRAETLSYVPPRNETEAALVEIWEQVLDLDRVGIDDRFFSLGGDSILSLRVRSRAEARGIHFSLDQLFEHQTLRELARHLEISGGGPAAPIGPFGLLAPDAPERVDERLEDAYPLAALQAGMLFHGAFTAASALYHNVSSLRLETVFDGAALRGAVADLLARHPVLRTDFDLGRDGEPVQRVHRRIEPPLAVADLRGLTAAAQEQVLAAAFEEELHRKLDPAVAPLLRFRVHLLGERLVQLTWTEHHAILDGWSVATMIRELFELYSRRRRPDLPPLPPLPEAIFRDFVALERRSRESSEHRQFWLAKLADAPRTRLPRLPGAAAEGAAPPRMRERSATVGPELTAGLKRLAGSAGVPLKSVLLAAHLRSLATTLGEVDLVTGLVANGRPEVQDAERGLGLFLNTLPLRLPEGETWLDLVQQVFAAEREMSPFRRFPMAELQRLTGGGPLFETAFNFIHFHVLRGMDDGETRVLGEKTFAQMNFPFTASFSLDLASSRIDLSLQYDEARLHPSQIAALAGRYLRTLAELAADPRGSHASGALLSAAERQQLLVEWNDTGAPEAGLCLHELISTQALRTPDAIAVELLEDRLTYAELDLRAERLAVRLRRLGVGPEVRVGIAAGRSLAMVVGLLGILKAGGVYVALDPAYPPERLAYMLEDSGAPLLLAEPRLLASLPEHRARIVPLDETAFSPREGEGVARVDRPARVLPDNLAYLIYTSGSTGAPKAVAIGHRGAVALARWARATFSDEELSRVLFATSICFDLSVFELFVPLAWGGRAILAENALALPSLAAGEVTLVNTVPSAMAELVREGAIPASIRTVNLAGEALECSLVRDLYEAGVERIWNLYGPSEDTTYSTSACMVREADELPAIGRPIAGTRAYVLDRDGQLAACGAPGELHLGGVGLARGYCGRPGLTAECFVPHPFGDPGERLYRTGDRVRSRPSGELEFLGRLDHQVKVRGFRIEPGEIEAVLAAHPAVERAVVILREDRPLDPRLVAYVVRRGAEDGLGVDAAALRDAAGKHLPPYMVPAAFVFLDRLPLTANGKVDRRALPAPETALPEPGAAALAPRDLTELELVRHWEAVLGCPSVGVRDDFFALGGHSLLAVPLMARIERSFGVGLPMATLLRHPTIESLAAVLRERGGAGRRGAPVELAPGSARPVFWVHPIGGEVLCYVHLARHLAGERGIYALERGDRAAEEAEASVEKMAASYLRKVRRVQPEGPYSLGGWSMGGVVAFEMARQLEAAGETVDLLALLDSSAPGAPGGAEEPEEALLSLFAADLARLSGAELEPLADPGEPGADMLDRLADQAERSGLLPPGLGRREVARRFAIFRANFRALERYSAGPSSAAAVLFRAAERRGAAPMEPDLGWGRWVRRLDVREVPGDHYSLLQKPNVSVLAALLRERLGRGGDGKEGWK